MYTQRFPLGELIIWLGILVTLSLFVLSKGTAGIALLPLTVSQITALLGAYLLSFSLILSSRLPGLEFWFGGLDKVYKTHHIVGSLAYGFLTQHLAWLIIQSLPNTKTVSIYLVPYFNNIPYGLGILAFWLMSLLIILTLFTKLPYQVWLATHRWFGTVALLALLHVFLISSDVSRYAPLKYWMLSWLLFGFLGSLYKRYLYRLIGPKFAYSISHIVEFDDVVTLQLSPMKNSIKFIPGQFVFLETGISPEHHPFSIVSAPSDDTLMLKAKIVGDYTLQLKGLRNSDSVTVYGPYGAFFRKVHKNSKIACIAGGIGITPFLSLIAEWSHDESLVSQVALIHSVRSSQNAVNMEKLTELEKQIPGFSYFLHQSSTDGRLSGEKVKQIVSTKFMPDFYYLCGPLPMMLAMRDQLVALGVSYRAIIFEDFSLL